MSEAVVVPAIALIIALAFCGVSVSIAVKNRATQTHLSTWGMARVDRSDDEFEFQRQTYGSPILAGVICLFLLSQLVGAL